jgi:hypothetical protein
MIALDNSNFYGIPFIGRSNGQQTSTTPESPQTMVNYDEKQDSLTSS